MAMTKNGKSASSAGAKKTSAKSKVDAKMDGAVKTAAAKRKAGKK